MSFPPGCLPSPSLRFTSIKCKIYQKAIRISLKQKQKSIITLQYILNYFQNFVVELWVEYRMQIHLPRSTKSHGIYPNKGTSVTEKDIQHLVV